MRLPYKVSDTKSIQKNFDYLASSLSASSFLMTYTGGATGNIYANGIFSKVTFDAFEWDESKGAASLANDNVVVRKAGKYFMTGGTLPAVAIGAAVHTMLAFYLNGGEYRRVADNVRGGAINAVESGSTFGKFAVGDTVDLRYFQATGAAIAQAAIGAPYIYFGMIWLPS